MSTHNSSTDQGKRLRQWVVPAVGLLIGLGYLTAGILGDNLAFGLGGLALMVAISAALLLAGRRSETVAGLLDNSDERINSIDADATRFAGIVVIVAVLAMFVVEIARGHDGAPYFQLGALGGISYVLALLWLRYRR